MLTINPAQLEVLRYAELEVWLARHVRAFFGERCDALGPAGLDSAIRQQVQRALEYGFRREADVTKYVDVAFALGLDFDRDPELAWVAEFVPNPKGAEPSVTAQLLLRRAVVHLADLEEIALEEENVEDDIDDADEYADIFEAEVEADDEELEPEGEGLEDGESEGVALEHDGHRASAK